jgi:predicted transcriptional regulator
MFKNEEYIKNFDTIFEDVKFTSNSFVRLKILASLYDSPQDMREMTKNTGLSYSSISSNMHDLELKNLLYREHNKYFLTNSARVRIENVLELKRVISLINKFFNILDGHIVDVIPNESAGELYILEKARLMESTGVDAYRTYNFIENTLCEAESVRCIIPFFYEPFFDALSELISKNKDVEILVPEILLDLFQEKSDIEIFVPFKEHNSFLFIITEDVMILGFFLENGKYDQNRLLMAIDEDSLGWANDLFEKFKNENK